MREREREKKEEREELNLWNRHPFKLKGKLRQQQQHSAKDPNQIKSYLLLGKGMASH